MGAPHCSSDSTALLTAAKYGCGATSADSPAIVGQKRTPASAPDQTKNCRRVIAGKKKLYVLTDDCPWFVEPQPHGCFVRAMLIVTSLRVELIVLYATDRRTVAERPATPVSDRRLPRQRHSLRPDSRAGIGLGTKVSGGTAKPPALALDFAASEYRRAGLCEHRPALFRMPSVRQPLSC